MHVTRTWPQYRLFWLMASVLTLAALGWLVSRRQPTLPPPPPASVDALQPGIVARMDSALFEYGPGWQISPIGADPSEPADPWTEPAGRFSFIYSGKELAMQLAVGNYWGFLYITVDGAPANRLPLLADNRNSQGQSAGYKPLLAPEAQTPAGPSPQWFVIHKTEEEGPHKVEVEVWRSWGQIPVRAVAVDALPNPPLPVWPAVAVGALAVWMAILALAPSIRTILANLNRWKPTLPFSVPNAMPLPLAGSSLLLLGGGVVSDSWLLTDLGLGLLAWVGLHRPVLWTGALLFGLPFYLYSLPILPTRALNLIEIGIWGGWVVLAGHWAVDDRNPKSATSKIDVAELVTKIRYSLFNPHLFLAAIIMLALIAVFASAQQDVALREWRTIFLSAGGFALLLAGTLATEPQRHSRQTLLSCWLLGGTTIAMVGLWQYASGRMLIEAEGVERVRAFYGSPNNLALYLDRTIAVTLALALFEDSRKTIGDLSHSRFFWWLLALPQLAALLLTFSKGSLVLALPAMLSTLGVGGYILLRQRGDSLRPLWGLAAVGMGMLIGLLPFIEAERFRSLADFSAGTTGGVRLNLWRSSLHMALDHPLLGVGPDNFLYAYRSNYILPAAWQDPDLNHPHNVVLDWWTRLGLGGLLLAMGWLLAGGRRLWRNLLAANHAALSLGCLAAVAAGLAHGLIDASYALPDLMLVWVLLLGLINMKGHIQCNH